ncbi:hypothetical protein [Spirosoma jeollabukense]
MNTGTEMNELEKNTPDDFWRKAFDEAAETPPPRVWDAIERRLDESEGTKTLPLWGSGLVMSRPLGWAMGIAATVALLLVGWWLVNTESVNQPTAQLHQPGPAANVAVRPLAPEKSATASRSKGAGNVPTDQPTDAVASIDKPAPQLTPAQTLVSSTKKGSNKPSNGSIARSKAAVDRAIPSTNNAGDDLPTQLMVSRNLRRSPSSSVTTQLPPSILSATHERAALENRMAHMAVQTSAAYPKQSATSSAPTATDAAVFEQLTGRPLRLRTIGPIQRIVWFRAAELPMEPEVSKSQRKSREMWASASVMPGAFNPMVALKSTQAAYANALVAGTTNQSSVTSRANFSVAYQAGAGVQLNEHWSVESGIGYLAGHSTIETPAQVASSNYIGAVANQNVVTSNLYVDAIQNSLVNKATASSAPQTALDLVSNNSFYSQYRYSSQTQEVLTNNYQYMQVPVQVGYQLRPRKRLSMALLGGILTNIFVKNTVGNDVVVTAKDGVYRPVSLAATMGARFRYRSTGKWSASLAGLYQPSLEFGTKPDSQVQSRPTSTGMSFGVDYHF